MALVRVRSKQPIDGHHIETSVDEAWLERWPEDFVRLDDLDAAQDELEQAGVPEEQSATAATAAVAIAESDDAFGAEVVDEPSPEPVPESEPEEPAAKHVVAVDPTVSAD